MLQVQGKALGRRKPLFADFAVPPPPELGDGGSTTMHDLIGAVVRHEVVAFRTRQTDRQTVRAHGAPD